MYKIVIPQMGDYSTPAKYLISHIIDCEIISIPITNKTLELGSSNSPLFVCTPFKYTLGSFIEGLEKGADVLIQFGGGCRYGYYFELQKQILEDLGYKFEMINLITKGEFDYKRIKKEIERLGLKLNKLKTLYYIFLSIKMVKYMDKIDFYIREHIGFEKENGSFIKLKKQMLKDFSTTKNYFHLKYMYLKYKRKFKKIELDNSKRKYKVGIIGELYTLMEPFANYNLEYELAKMGISVKRYTNVNYLLFEKKYKIKDYLSKTKDYIKYKMGADASDNIARCKYLCKHNYDGIIHMKSSFCTPEIGAMPIINKICKKYDVPVLYFSFDTETSEVGVKTRLEAFFDMIEMRRTK